MVKSMTVLGVKHKICVDDKKLAKYLEDTEYTVDEIRGLYDDGSRTIYIRETLDDLSFVQTFLHEWIHAVGFITGQADLIGNTRKSEQFTEQLACAVLDLLRQPHIVEFLTSKLKAADAQEKD